MIFINIKREILRIILIKLTELINDLNLKFKRLLNIFLVWVLLHRGTFRKGVQKSSLGNNIQFTRAISEKKTQKTPKQENQNMTLRQEGLGIRALATVQKF